MTPETELHAGMDVFILAENRLLREALARRLQKEAGIRVISTSAFDAGTLQQLIESKPRVLILDPVGLEASSTHLIAEAARGVPGLKVLLIGMEADSVTFLRFVRAGIAGYLLKDASAVELIAAVRSASKGQAVCPPELCLALFDWVARQEIPISNLNRQLQARLTRRELQILQIISFGHTNKEVATQLNLSEQTVKNHVHRVLQKLGAANRLAALDFLHLQGLNDQATNNVKDVQ